MVLANSRLLVLSHFRLRWEFFVRSAPVSVDLAIALLGRSNPRMTVSSFISTVRSCFAAN